MPDETITHSLRWVPACGSERQRNGDGDRDGEGPVTVGARIYGGAVTPVPVKSLQRMMLLPASTRRLANFAPTEVGRKITLIGHDAPTATELPHVVVKAKSARLRPRS